ncbi:MAG TPA: hypothetical protein VM871_10860 [Flavisolibacter sp.]|jgi:hypothetical protein|nr:hypothetical protein [Flavisolibacter sp.]
MKCLALFWFLFFSLSTFAQADSVRKIEPGMETSFDNYELLIIAIVGLLLLIGLRFWFRRTRKR